MLGSDAKNLTFSPMLPGHLGPPVLFIASAWWLNLAFQSGNKAGIHFERESQKLRSDGNEGKMSFSFTR